MIIIVTTKLAVVMIIIKEITYTPHDAVARYRRRPPAVRALSAPTAISDDKTTLKHYTYIYIYIYMHIIRKISQVSAPSAICDNKP